MAEQPPHPRRFFCLEVSQRDIVSAPGPLRVEPSPGQLGRDRGPGTLPTDWAQAPTARPPMGTASPQSSGAERAGLERPSALPPQLSLQIGHGSGAQAQRCPAGPEEAMGHSHLPVSPGLPAGKGV